MQHHISFFFSLTKKNIIGINIRMGLGQRMGLIRLKIERKYQSFKSQYPIFKILQSPEPKRKDQSNF